MKLAALLLTTAALALVPVLLARSRSHAREIAAVRNLKALAAHSLVEPTDGYRLATLESEGLWFAVAAPELPDLRELVANEAGVVFVASSVTRF